MGWTRLGTLAMLLIFMLTVSIFGGHFGYTVKGVPQGGAITVGQPNALNIFQWAGDTLSYFWNMLSFQIDGMPEFVSGIFVIITLLSLLIIIEIIRGN